MARKSAKKISFTRQALLVLFFGLLQSIAIWAIVLLNTSLIPPIVQLILLIGSLLYFVISIYSAYVTNCVLVGHCRTLSWYLVAVSGIVTMLVPFHYYTTLLPVLRELKKLKK